MNNLDSIADVRVLRDLHKECVGSEVGITSRRNLSEVQ